MNNKIIVNQEVNQMEGNSQMTGVDLKVYSYFQATPERLRRSFDTLMTDKIRGFVGRNFVFDAWDDYQKSHPSGYFVIRGIPGIGKTALMARLINDKGYIHHFNIASQNIRGIGFFLENACAQIISRYGLNYKELPPQAVEDSGFLLQCLSEAAEKRKNHPIILAIDALDEADRQGLAPAANSMYLPPSLPEGVYILVTTRPLDEMRLQVAQLHVLDLEADSQGNLKDIGEYIENYAQKESMQSRLLERGINIDEFVITLKKMSQGNFMYLHYVLPAIEQGRFIKGTLDDLPYGLKAYYQSHWRQMREGNDSKFDNIYEPIVCILGVAQEPVTVQQISAWTRLHQGQVKEAIKLWREFLEEEKVEDKYYYRIYHASFQDFLKEQVDLVRYDGMIADYYLALAGLKE